MKFLAALAPYLINHVVRYIFTALGVSIVTYIGFDLLLDNLKNRFISEMGTIPAGAIQLFYIAGGGVVLNIFFGLLAFVVTFKTLSKIGFGRKAS